MDLTGNIIVFDLDDTLYKEIDFVYSGISYCIEKIKEKGFSCEVESVASLYQSNKKEVFQSLIELSDAQEEIQLSDLLSWYRAHQPAIQLDEDVREMLFKLKENGACLALITDGRSLTQRNKIKALRIEELFEGIFISEEQGYSKPHRHSFVEIETQTGGNIFWYVANDTTKDFLTPCRRGWRTVGLTDDGRNIHSQDLTLSPEYLPQVWIDSLQELPVVIERILLRQI